MARPLRVFVSHSDQDNAFCHSLVQALRHAGADVWYEEHNDRHSARRRELTLMREVYGRPVFLVVLSTAACASASVQQECTRAYNHYLYWPTRVLLPVVGAPYQPGDVKALGRLAGQMRIETPDHQPLPPDEAARR
ncbi:MAG TPA: toll/interleukin-1 receptor domain-containing protein, partial [Ktedonobacterales bacterium]|nr:toll/interleukin-1 receptor domain-containing protein [Ktedonobacterales bacterium]